MAKARFGAMGYDLESIHTAANMQQSAVAATRA
jgi:hypothetical protein